MDKSAIQSEVSGEITAPASKSYAQRAIAAALLAEGESRLTNMTLCDDTEAAIGVARALGATITAEGRTYTVKGGLNPRTEMLDVRESGLAARLFTPIAALSSLSMTLTGSGSIMRRPVDMMEEPLEALGVEVMTNGGYLPIEVEGPMQGGDITVDGSLSSQFVTGLLMALPLAQNNTVMTVRDLNSKPYVDMTLEVMDAFGVTVKHERYSKYYLEVEQNYVPAEYNIEGDWSGASCMLVAGAIAGEVTVHNLNMLSLQADARIIEALERAGAEITTTGDSVTVRKTALNAFAFDATDCPDLFPALAALAANCEGTSDIKGMHRLAHKESNRAEAIANVFGAMGIAVDIDSEDVMSITGGPISNATVSSHGDHRIAMAAAVAALNCEERVVIAEAEAVAKSYPEFWADLSHIRKRKTYE